MAKKANKGCAALVGVGFNLVVSLPLWIWILYKGVIADHPELTPYLWMYLVAQAVGLALTAVVAVMGDE